MSVVSVWLKFGVQLSKYEKRSCDKTTRYYIIVDNFLDLSSGED